MFPRNVDANRQQKSRMVFDCQKLNDISLNMVYPLPWIDEILDILGKAKYLSTLELAEGYYQVIIDKKDREKMAFSTPMGHYKYNNGSKNSSVHFSVLNEYHADWSTVK